MYNHYYITIILWLFSSSDDNCC